MGWFIQRIATSAREQQMQTDSYMVHNHWPHGMCSTCTRSEQDWLEHSLPTVYSINRHVWISSFIFSLLQTCFWVLWSRFCWFGHLCKFAGVRACAKSEFNKKKPLFIRESEIPCQHGICCDGWPISKSVVPICHLLLKGKLAPATLLSRSSFVRD